MTFGETSKNSAKGRATWRLSRRSQSSQSASIRGLGRFDTKQGRGSPPSTQRQSLVPQRSAVAWRRSAYARLQRDGRSGMRGLPDALSSEGRRGISCRKEQWARGNGRVLLCSLLSRSDALQAHVEGVMQANVCYLCSRPFGLIRHRHGSKQFCSKKCLHEWRPAWPACFKKASSSKSVRDVFGTGSPGLAEGARFPRSHFRSWPLVQAYSISRTELAESHRASRICGLADGLCAISRLKRFQDQQAN